MTIRLHNYSMIPPGALQRLAGRFEEATVLDDGSIRILEMELRPAYGQPQLAPGTKVVVWLSDHFYCDTAEAIAAALVERHAQEERDKAEQLAVSSRRRADAEAFNAQFSLPVRWSVGHKDVLSGLSEASWGDGYRRNTVEHILLQETLSAGPLVRSAGDFLCTSRSGSNGKAWSGMPQSVAVDAAGEQYAPKITCKSCLRLAARWKREPQPEVGPG